MVKAYVCQNCGKILFKENMLNTPTDNNSMVVDKTYCYYCGLNKKGESEYEKKSN